MSNKDKTIEEMQDGDIIEFGCEDGSVEQYEYLDTINYNGADYVLLYPHSDNIENPESVHIFEIIEVLDADYDEYAGVADQAVVDAVYGLFMEKHKDDPDIDFFE